MYATVVVTVAQYGSYMMTLDEYRFSECLHEAAQTIDRWISHCSMFVPLLLQLLLQYGTWVLHSSFREGCNASILRQLRNLSGVRATKGVHENNVHGIGITMLTHIQQKKNIYIRCIQLQKERAGRPSHRSYETATSPLLQDWKSQISWSRTSSCVAVTIEWWNAEIIANFPDGMILSVTLHSISPHAWEYKHLQ